MAVILVVDDETAILKVLKTVLNFRHYHVLVAESGSEALDLLRENRVDLMLTDVIMRPMDGFELLKSAKQLYPNLAVVFMTGFETIANSIAALQLGVFDCIRKPVRMEELIEVIDHALKAVHSGAGESDAVLPAPVSYRFGTIIAESLDMQRVCQEIERAAAMSAPTLLCGEAGNGKSLIARAIHDYSPRKNGEFVTINCASTPEEVIERRIFGTPAQDANDQPERTDAEAQQSADSGSTILLNGILMMPPALLKQLALHLLKGVDGKDGSKISPKVGLVLAADATLESLSQMGGFATLLSQICSMTISLKPLRERSMDIPPLLSHFFYQHIGDWKKLPVLASDAYASLLQYPWPGNHSELALLVNDLLPQVKDSRITKDMLPAKISGFRPADHRGESLKTFLNAQIPKKKE